MSNSGYAARGAWRVLLLAGLVAACQDAALPTEPEQEPESGPSVQANAGAAATAAAQSAAALQDALRRLAPGIGPTVAAALIPSLREAAEGLATGDAEAALAALDRAAQVLGARASAETPNPERDAIRLAIHVARTGLDSSPAEL